MSNDEFDVIKEFASEVENTFNSNYNEIFETSSLGNRLSIFIINGFDYLKNNEPIVIDDDITIQKINYQGLETCAAFVRSSGKRWIHLKPDKFTGKNQSKNHEKISLDKVYYKNSTKETSNPVLQEEIIAEENLQRLRIFLACINLSFNDGEYLQPILQDDWSYRDFIPMPNIFFDTSIKSRKFAETINVDDFRTFTEEQKNIFASYYLECSMIDDRTFLPPTPPALDLINNSREYHEKIKSIILNEDLPEHTRNRIIFSLVNYQDAKEGLDSKWAIIKLFISLETWFSPKTGKNQYNEREMQSFFRIILSETSMTRWSPNYNFNDLETRLDNYDEDRKSEVEITERDNFLRRIYEIRNYLLHGRISFETHGGLIERDKRHLADITKSLIRIMIEQIISGKTVDEIQEKTRSQARLRYPELQKNNSQKKLKK